MGMIQVCLNGARSAADSRAVPLTPAAMAESAARAVAAGAVDVHVHPKTPCGADTLSPRVVAEVLTAIRAAVDVPVGVTTGAWAEPDPAHRVRRIRDWTVLPDHASVNWHEEGAEAVAAALLERGVGVEAGIWSGTKGARLLPPVRVRTAGVARARRGDGHRRLVRRGDGPALLDELGTAHGRPVLLHGEDGGAWPVLRLAGRLGLDTRVGLEDVMALPDGSAASSNAQLVSCARDVCSAQAGDRSRRKTTGPTELLSGEWRAMKRDRGA